MIRCSKCDKEAIIYQRYSGQHLCRHHFTVDFETRAKRAIRKHHWIQSGDTIAVAISGGKDSSALLHFLTRTFGKRPDLRIIALTIDEGIGGYRDPEVVTRLAASMGVDCYSASFQEAYGLTMDKVVEKLGDRRSCSYCGVLRRQLLNRKARELGATRLALGFNLDDDAQSVLMNVLRGDTERLLQKMKPVPGMVPRIRPFTEIPEREVALYANLYVKDFEDAGCPYAHNALRADVRTHLNEYAYSHPATKFALVNLGEELRGLSQDPDEEFTTCESCGEPCYGGCRACQILDEVRGDG